MGISDLPGRYRKHKVLLSPKVYLTNAEVWYRDTSHWRMPAEVAIKHVHTAMTHPNSTAVRVGLPYLPHSIRHADGFTVRFTGVDISDFDDILGIQTHSLVLAGMPGYQAWYIWLKEGSAHALDTYTIAVRAWC